MNKLARWLIRIPLMVLIALFLIANRQPVSISLDPMSTQTPAIVTPALPLWLWLSLAMLAGFFAGAYGMWSSGKDKRASAKAERRELQTLKKDLAATAQHKAATATKSSDLPVLESS